jgi:hypothetical protein
MGDKFSRFVAVLFSGSGWMGIEATKTAVLS